MFEIQYSNGKKHNFQKCPKCKKEFVMQSLDFKKGSGKMTYKCGCVVKIKITLEGN